MAKAAKKTTKAKTVVKKSEPVSAMDYSEHEKTYDLFLWLSRWTVVGCMGLLVAMMFGFYGGGVPSINVARGSTAGVLLAVDSGVLPGNGWSADLGVNPPRLVGRGTGEDELAKLLERADLSAAAALPAPSLVAYEDMLPGGIFTTVVVDEWPEGWSGKTIWVVLPKDVDAEGLSQAMNAALRLRKDLRAAK